MVQRPALGRVRIRGGKEFKLGLNDVRRVQLKFDAVADEYGQRIGIYLRSALEMQPGEDLIFAGGDSGPTVRIRAAARISAGADQHWSASYLIELETAERLAGAQVKGRRQIHRLSGGD